MTRKSFRYWWTPLLLGPACALALEIGEIQVGSSLNQLFDAKIPLPTLAPEELGKVSVRLAAPPMFKEFGLERAPALANLVFSVEYNAEGQVYVRIVSTQPIREPSLALLLEFGWPRGKTFREFTVFLDPVQRLAKRSGDRTKTVLNAPADAAVPGVVPGPEIKPMPEAAPTLVAAAPAPAEIPDESPLPVEAPPPPVKTYQPGDTYGPVVPGEGLWGIALKLRPDPGITRDQMMQALFQANPQAFSKAGIGGLKIGATLRIPTLREIADFSGSTVARRLAEAEQAAAVDKVQFDAESTPAASTKTPTDQPEVFPLAPPAVPEPVAVSPATSPEPAKPVPEAQPEAKPEVKPEPEPVKPEAAAKSEAALVKVESESEAKPEPEPAKPEPELANIESELAKLTVAETKPEPAATAAPAPEAPAPPAPEPPAAATASAPEASAPPAPTSESMAMTAVSEPVIPEPTAQAPEVAPESGSPILEPVSATPLLFLVVSEMLETLPQIPMITTLAQTASESPAAAATESKPVRETTTDAEVAPVVATEPAGEPVTSSQVAAVGAPAPTMAVAPDSPPTVTEPGDSLAAIEKRDSQALADTPPAPPSDAFTRPVEAVAASIVSEPAAPTTLEPPVEPQATVASEPPTIAETEPPVKPPATVELPATAETEPSVEPPTTVELPPTAETELPVEPSVTTTPEPSPELPATTPARQGGDQYGPVSVNERLWDIAAKVRPDPSIGKDVMMKALFMANPQAFSKPSMDHLKVGSILRIPTLREIADYTGSKAAKQLLEQWQPMPGIKPVQ